MQKYHIYIFIIFSCTFALAYRWFSKPVVQLNPQSIETIEIEATSEPRPFKYTTRQAPKPIAKKEDMKMKIIKAQADDPSFLPFDSEGNLYVENVIIDDEWAIAYGDQLVGRAEELIRLEQEGGTLKIPKPKFWKNGVVPFELSPSLSPSHRTYIKAVMLLFSEKASIHFKPRETEPDYIIFKAGGLHCYSHVGRIGGEQDIVLGPDCKGPQITHEVMHALGFYHEQSRLDRDEHIMIMWENIEEKFHEQFKKIPPIHFSIEDSEFDLKSIMMYPPKAFSISPEDPSILTINGELYQPEQSLSQKDLIKIERIYGKKN